MVFVHFLFVFFQRTLYLLFTAYTISTIFYLFHDIAARSSAVSLHGPFDLGFASVRTSLCVAANMTLGEI